MSEGNQTRKPTGFSRGYLTEADYCLSIAIDELNEIRRPLSDLADAEEKELGEREMARGYEVV